MPKIYLAIGHGTQTNGVWDPGCVNGDYTEADLMFKIGEFAVKELRKYGIDVGTDWDSGNDRNITYCVRDANKWGADLYISLHCDWIKAPSGMLSLVASDRGRRLASCMTESVKLRMGLPNRGIQESDDYEVLETNMPAVIFETGSIGADLAVLRNNYISYGHSIAYGILDYLGMTEIYLKDLQGSGGQPPKPNTGLYKVQAGAYRSKDGAELFSASLKKDGFDNFIKQENGLYKVQLGAFSKKENAKGLSDQLKNKGIDNFNVFYGEEDPKPVPPQTNGDLKYFGPDEFKCECGCGGDVSPELKQKFDLAREILGSPLIITSGYRCKKQNAIDGGVPDSLHMYGEAADCYSPGIGVETVRAALKSAGLGVGIYYSSQFCHGQLSNWDFVGD